MIDNLIQYIKRKLERRRIKRTFQEYDYQVVSLTLPQYGKVDVAQCLNPLFFNRLPAKERYDLYDSIQKKGYNLYYIEKFEADTPKVLLKRENMTDWKHFDVVATPFKWREA